MFYEGVRNVNHDEDLNTMMYSIENRAPFLDRQLFEIAYSIPNEYLIQNGVCKSVLRKAAEGYLPDKVRLDVQKKGFNVSFASMFKLGSPGFREYFLNEKSEIAEIVNLKAIRNILDRDTLPNSYSKFLFNLLNAKLFLEK